jgi:transposase
MRPTVYRRNGRGLRDRQGFEQVRMQAGALFAAGRCQAEVARELGVARQTSAPGTPAGKRAGWRRCAAPARPGTPRGLSERELAAIRQALRQGARAHGFDTDYRTLVRVGSVIEQVTGVAYHPGHVWKLLRRRLGWRLHRPARRAIERDEHAIARWMESD